MKTYLECIPCFFKQGLNISKVWGIDEKKRKEIIDKIAIVVPSFPLTSSSPEMGKIIQDIITEVLGNNDPYERVKKESNKIGLSIYDKLKEKIDSSQDKLLTGIELSIAGNIIDYGANHNLCIDSEISKILNKKSGFSCSKNFQYEAFKEKLESSDLLLFLGDNAGEIVFDKIFIEEIIKLYPYKKIIYAVREAPIINDATMEDAIFVGLDKVVDVISSGSLLPGTLLSQCSKEFVKLFNEADIIISKGQGNFETLSEEKTFSSLFFLLVVKCQVVGRELKSRVGDIILKNVNSLDL